MSERLKFRNEKKLTDDELLAVLETNDYDSYFDDSEIDNAASDIENSDTVSQQDETEDILHVSDTEDELADDTAPAGESVQQCPMYFAKDGSEWAKIPVVTRVKRAKYNILKTHTGLTTYSSNFSSIKEAFEIFFSEDIIDIILTESNRKATHFYKAKGKKFSPILQEELEAFIGLLFIFGALHANKEPICVLWSQNPSLCRPIVSAGMSRNRFQQIMCFLRFDNYETREERKRLDKLAPVRELFDIFVSNCKKSFNPGEHLCVDEQLVPFRGRAPFRVYMKSKPDKYGIKIWAMADCKSAYTVNMQVYLGKQGNIPERGQGQRVVLDLVHHLSSGYGITTDNFFTGIELADKLLERNLTLCGTLRRNKPYIPHELLPARYKQEYSSMFAFKKNKTLVSYVPKKNSAVILLSTEHTDDKVSGEENSYKPEIILHYNNTKGAVDTSDKLAKEYTTQRKTNRWPMAIFFHLLDIGGINSYKLWMLKNPSWKSNRLDNRRLFLLELGEELLKKNIARRYTNEKSIPSKIKQHMVTILPELREEDKKPVPTVQKPQRCYLCTRNKDRKSRNNCNECHQYVCAEHSKNKIICDNCDS